MTNTVQASFDTRRDAELAVERLVQEHKIDRKAIAIQAEGARNSAGVEESGADSKSGPSGDGAPQLNGRVEVIVAVAGIDLDTLHAALRETGAKSIATSG